MARGRGGVGEEVRMNQDAIARGRGVDEEVFI